MSAGSLLKYPKEDLYSQQMTSLFVLLWKTRYALDQDEQNEKEQASPSNNLLLEYYFSVIELYESKKGCEKYAVEFAFAALGISDKKDSKLSTELWIKVFNFSFTIGDFDTSYTALVSIPDLKMYLSFSFQNLSVTFL